MACNALAHQALEYTCMAFDPHDLVPLEELKKVQNQVARSVTGNYLYETWSVTVFLGHLLNIEVMEIYLHLF